MQLLDENLLELPEQGDVTTKISIQIWTCGISENPVKLSGEEFLKYLTTGWTGLTDLPVQLLDENLQTTS